MLVNELKEEIKKYDKKELESIIVELYKRIPKTKKEDYNIDEFIKNIKSKNKTQKKEVSFEELEKEIIYFLECVDNDLYAEPNRIISKKERSTWRFKVKRYYKELTSILPASPSGNMATSLLIEIFRRLSIGSNTLLFTSWKTFSALGVSQASYYDVIVKRIFFDGYTKEKLQKCIELLTVPQDPYVLSDYLFNAFLSNLKTVDYRLMAIDLLNDKIKDFKMKLTGAKDYHKKFELKELINDFVECILNIYFVLHEVSKGINYFHENYIESDKEVKEYILLEELEEANLDDFWLKEYESKINIIDFRDSLKEKYNDLKNKQKEN